VAEYLPAAKELMAVHDRRIRLVIANLAGDVRERLVRGWEIAATTEGLFSASVAALPVAFVSRWDHQVVFADV